MTQVVISLDCTRSMHTASHVLQSNVTTLVNTLFDNITNLKLAIVCHGDEPVDPHHSKTSLPLTWNKKDIVTFVNKIPRYGPNGTEEEYYQEIWKYVANSLELNLNEPSYYIFCGDSSPSERLWRNDTKHLIDKFNKIFAVKCLDNPCGHRFWHEFVEHLNTSKPNLATLIPLSQFADVANVITTLCLYSESVDVAQNFAELLPYSKSFQQSVQALFNGKLRQEPIIAFKQDNDLVPVNLSRFQRLDVQNSVRISDFVLSTGATFKPGRGFYQLINREIVQENKEIILVDVHGNMYTGTKVREMLGLPYGVKGRLGPSDVPTGYTAFVQSRSYTRQLDKGTTFLYEMEY